ncbi:FecR family protein [Hydrogenophaga electricum]|nr:FecR domain-containing protein [Hydrogenophaga electricum]
MPLIPPSSSPDPAAPADADEREFDAFAQAQDGLDIEAATWVVRQRDGLDDDGEAALQAWLAADPRHRAAFDDMADTLGEVQQLPAGDQAALRDSLGDRAAPARPVASAQEVPGTGRPAWPPQSPVPDASRRTGRPVAPGWGGFALRRHALLASLVLTAGMAGWMGWDHWQRQPWFEQHYATLRGQQRMVRLPDDAADRGQPGSTLHLDVATQLDARLYRDRRELRLDDGQVMLAVAPDAARPLQVRAGALRITVVGTRFAVRHTASGLGAGRTEVVVEEGRVRVSGPLEDAPALELTAGQRVSADAEGRLGPAEAVPAASVAAWREGRISFDHTPLAEALAEFERYGPTGVVVTDPGVAALPVGGSYSVRQFPRFVDTLPQMLPVRLVVRGAVTEVVAR